jgi:nucleoside-triphosphatase THEP1
VYDIAKRRGLVGLAAQTKALSASLTDPSLHRAIVLGPSGSGKTTMVLKVFRDLKLRHVVLDSVMADGGITAFKTMVSAYVGDTEILAIMSGTRTDAILIDDIDAMISKDKGIAIFIKAIVIPKAKLRGIRVVITCANKNDRVVADLRKHISTTIRVGHPATNITFPYVCSVAEEAGIDVNHDRILEVVRRNTNSISVALRFVATGLGEGAEASASASASSNIESDHALDMNIFDVTDYVVHRGKVPSKVLGSHMTRLTGHDTNTITLMVHENLTSFYPNMSLKHVTSMLDRFIVYDKFMHSCYKGGGSNVSDIATAFSIGMIAEASRSNKVVAHISPKFTTVITKMSAKSIFQRRMLDTAAKHRVPTSIAYIGPIVQQMIALHATTARGRSRAKQPPEVDPILVKKFECLFV